MHCHILLHFQIFQTFVTLLSFDLQLQTIAGFDSLLHFDIFYFFLRYLNYHSCFSRKRPNKRALSRYNKEKSSAYPDLSFRESQAMSKFIFYRIWQVRRQGERVLQLPHLIGSKRRASSALHRRFLGLGRLVFTLCSFAFGVFIAGWGRRAGGGRGAIVGRRQRRRSWT